MLSKAGHAVLDLVRRSGSTKQKSDLMLTLSQAASKPESQSGRLRDLQLVEAYLEKKEHEEALAICREMQDHFTQKGLCIPWCRQVIRAALVTR